MKLNVVIVGDTFGFPEGTASTNYMRLLALGLKQAGAAVHVMPLYTDPLAAKNGVPCRGKTAEGITWEFASGRVSKPASKLARLGMKCRTDRRVMRRLRDLHQEGRMDVLLYNGWSYDLLLEYKYVCSRLNCPFVVQFLEWPMALPRTRLISRLNNRMFCRHVLKYADATVVISTFLEALVVAKSEALGDAKPCCRIPILVDPSSMSGVSATRRQHPYVLYCASMDAYGDDAIYVMDAFARANLTDTDLLMVGKATPSTQARIRTRAAALGLSSRVVMMNDYLETDALYGLFKGAKALLAPIHNDVRSLARFPFKVGEYLLSGKPVVSCAMGEVGRCLEDGKTAFLCSHDSVDAFTAQIQRATTDSSANGIAENGRALALTQFSNVLQGQRLARFLESLVR